MTLPPSRRTRWSVYATSLVLGLGLAVTFTNHFSLTDLPFREWLAVLAGVTVPFGLTTYEAALIAEPRLSLFSVRDRVLWAFASLSAGVLLILVTPIVIDPPAHYPAFMTTQLTWRAVLYAADVVSLAATIFFVSVLLAIPARGPGQAAPISRWSWLCYALPCATVWSLYLCAYWPAVMNWDSLVQFREVLTGQFHDWIPAFGTLIVWLLTRIQFSPSIVALVQIVSLALAAGWGFALIRRLGAPRGLVWCACLLFAFSPVNGSTVITIWKDIFYSTAVLVLSLMVALIVVSDGQWLQRPAAWISMGCIAALIVLLRHNGPPAAFGTLIALGLVYRRHWRPLLYSLALAVSLWLAITGPVFALVRVNREWYPPIGQSAALLPLMHQVAAQLSAGTSPTSEERAYLDTIRPVISGWSYYCDNSLVAPDLTPISYDWEAVSAHPDQLRRVWLALSLRNPRAVVDHLVCHSALIWRMAQPVGGYTASSMILRVSDQRAKYIMPDPNDLGIEPDSRLPALSGWLVNRVIVPTQQGGWLAVVWRPALYLYLLLAGAAIAAVRARNVKVLLVAVPSLLQSAFLAIVITASDVRYQYAVYLTSMVFWAWLYFGRWGHTDDIRNTA